MFHHLVQPCRYLPILTSSLPPWVSVPLSQPPSHHLLHTAPIQSQESACVPSGTGQGNSLHKRLIIKHSWFKRVRGIVDVMHSNKYRSCSNSASFNTDVQMGLTENYSGWVASSWRIATLGELGCALFTGQPIK